MDSITIVDGIKIGHSENRKGVTGCTVILCDPMAIGSMEMRGGATSTRQIDSLITSRHAVNFVNAVFFTGGSAFGLDAAGGVMRYLEEQEKGVSTSMGPVPVVPTAVIYDLALGKKDIRPDAGMGYEACLKATSGIVEEGSVGAGLGATVGKLYGISRAMKGGVGTAGFKIQDLAIGALVVVNAFGDVMDDENGKLLAGLRDSVTGLKLINSAKEFKKIPTPRFKPFENTVLTVVVTNAELSRSEAGHVAMMISGGLGRNISPVHTQFDGDVVFVLSLGKVKVDINSIGCLAAEVVAEAIKRAVKKADGLGIIPAYEDIA